MKGMTGVAAIVVLVLGVAAAKVAAAPRSVSLPLAYGFDGSSGWQGGQVTPRDIYFGAGGSLLVRGLHWASWTQKGAVGRGQKWMDNCDPSCAAGRYAKVNADVSLWRVRRHNGVSYFSRLTLRWTIAGKKYKTLFEWSPGVAPYVTPFWSIRIAPSPAISRAGALRRQDTSISSAT